MTRLARAVSLLSVAAAVAAVVIIALRAGAGLGEVALLLPPGSHLLAGAAFAVGVAARGARFVLLARGVGVRLTFRTSLLAQLAGDAAGAVTPMRVGSNPAKIAFAARDSLNLAGMGAVIVGETLAEAVVLLGVGGTLLFLLPGTRLPAAGTMAYGALMLAAAVAMMLVARLPLTRTPPRLWSRLRIGVRRWRQTRVLVRRYRVRLRSLRGLSAELGTGILLVSALHVASRLAVLPALAAGLGGAGPLGPMITWPLLLLYAGGLVPTPAGGGAVELGFARVLATDLPAQMLPGLTLWWRFYTFYLGALAGGLVLAAGSGALARRRARADLSVP